MKLSERAMMVTLSLGSWGASKTDRDLSRELVETHDADKGSMVAIKRTVDKKMLKNISNTDQKIRNTFKELTLPWTDSSRIVPMKSVWNVRESMYRLFDERDKHVSDFLSWYETFLASKASSFHGSASNIADFPTLEEVKLKFSKSLLFLPVADSNDFRSDNEDVKKLIEESSKEVTNTVTKELVSRLLSKVEKLLDVVTNFNICQVEEVTDKRSAPMREKSINAVKEFISELPDLNISNSQEINNLFLDLKNKFSYSADILKSDELARSEVIEDAETVLKRLRSFYGD